MEAIKTGGLKVLRATVTKSSRLIGRTAVDVQFSKNYKAAIVAVQKGGKNVTQPLSTLTFDAGDVLVLQVSEDCPLLSPSVESSRTSLLASITPKPKSAGKFDPEVCTPLIKLSETPLPCISFFNLYHKRPDGVLALKEPRPSVGISRSFRSERMAAVARLNLRNFLLQCESHRNQLYPRRASKKMVSREFLAFML